MPDPDHSVMPGPDHSVMPGPDRASLSLLYVKKIGPTVRLLKKGPYFEAFENVILGPS